MHITSHRVCESDRQCFESLNESGTKRVRTADWMAFVAFHLGDRANGYLSIDSRLGSANVRDRTSVVPAHRESMLSKAERVRQRLHAYLASLVDDDL